MTHASKSIRWRAGAIGVFISVMCLSAAAIEEKPMPAFTVTRADGAAVGSAQLTAVPQYVLMYVAPGCRPCDHLIGLLKDPQSPQLASRVVILVGGDVALGTTYVARQIPREAGAVTWYGDPTGEAYRAFQLTGTPVLIGVRQGRVIWSVSGVLNDASTVQSVVRSWVTY